MQTRITPPIITFLFLFLFTALALFATSVHAAQNPEDPHITVQMKNTQGESVGTVTVKQLAQGVLFVAQLKNLPPGPHAFHVHKKGSCQPKFQSAGGHYSPLDHEHGLDNPQGYHLGDLPNVHVAQNGTATASFFVDNLKLGKLIESEGHSGTDEEKPPFPLVDKDGSALMIHKKGDDYEAMPPDSAGPRIACGVIKQKQPESMSN